VAEPTADGGALGPRSTTVRRLRRLAGRRSARYDDRLLLVEGAVLVAEAVRAGWRLVDCVAEEHASDVARLTAEYGVVPTPVTAAALAAIATTETPQPVVATFEMPTRVLPAGGMLVVVDRMADPGNLGTVIRSAEAAGATAVVVTPGTTDWSAPKVVRASAGAVFHVPVVEATLDDLHMARWRLIGTSSHRGESYRVAVPGDRDAIVIGNEAHGLDEDAPIDVWVQIEHRGRSESLNAAMAATLLCFHWAGELPA